MLDKNPTKLLQDKYLQQYYKLCTYASSGLFPESGGSLNQKTEFLEFYEIFSIWKNIKKIEETK